MAEQTCPHCGKHVVVNAAGLCTNCREPVAGPKTTVNPEQRPYHVTAYASKVEHQQSFAYQACRFALIAPIVCFFLSSFSNSLRAKGEDNLTAVFVLMITIWLLVGLGTIFGLIGIVLSFQRRAWGTLLMGLVGFLMCGGLVAMILISLLG